jgi:hypothetical protein
MQLEKRQWLEKDHHSFQNTLIFMKIDMVIKKLTNILSHKVADEKDTSHFI